MAAEQPWFEKWFNSPYYGVLYLRRDELEAKGFLDRLMDHLQLPAGAEVLDVASGSGRHARELARRGFQVTGIDLSSRLIQSCSAREYEHLEFYVQDMRETFRINYYDAVFNFFTSFGYFETARENELALHNMSLALRAAGQLVLDYLNTSWLTSHLVENEVKIIRGVQFMIRRTLADGRFIKQIEVYDSSRLVKEIFVERVLAYTREDLGEMFQRNGLVITDSFGDYSLTPYQPGSSHRLILIATKTP